MRRSPTVVAVLALALGATLAGCAPSGPLAHARPGVQTASDPAGAPVPFTRLPMVLVHGEGALPQATRAPQQDADTAAQQEGRPVLAVERSTRGQDRFDAAVDAYERQHPDRFVGAGRNDAATLHWLTITGRPDAALLAAMRALPFDVTIRVDAPASAGTLRRWAAAAAAAVEHAGGVRDAAGDVDAAAGVLEVEYTGDGRVDVAALQRAAAAAAARAAGGRLPVGIAVLPQGDLVDEAGTGS